MYGDPVRPASTESVGEGGAIFREAAARQRHGAVFRQLVGVQEHARFTVQSVLNV